jgi:hypothetical protein
MFDLPRFRCATQITNQFPSNIVAEKTADYFRRKKKGGSETRPYRTFH